jgi:hypothetical protein
MRQGREVLGIEQTLQDVNLLRSPPPLKLRRDSPRLEWPAEPKPAEQGEGWWAVSDLNTGPSGCKPDALTAELTALGVHPSEPCTARQRNRQCSFEGGAFLLRGPRRIRHSWWQQSVKGPWRSRQGADAAASNPTGTEDSGLPRRSAQCIAAYEQPRQTRREQTKRAGQPEAPISMRGAWP